MRWIKLIFVIALLFFIPFSANALTKDIDLSTNTSAWVGFGDGSAPSYLFTDIVIQSFKPNVNTFEGLDLGIYEANTDLYTGDNLRVKLCKGSTGSTITIPDYRDSTNIKCKSGDTEVYSWDKSNICSNSGTYPQDSQSPCDSENNFTELRTSDTETLTIGDDYYIIILVKRTATHTASLYRGGTDYEDGAGYYSSFDFDNDPVSQGVDINFSTYGENGLSITSPLDNTNYQIVNTGSTTLDVLVEGTCPHNGDDQLLIMNDLYCRWTTDDDYTIPCTAGNYSATTTINFLGEDYPYFITVMDRAFSTAGQVLTGACVSAPDPVTGLPSDWAGRQHININITNNQEYNLRITYPDFRSDNTYTTQASNSFPVQMSYNPQSDYYDHVFTVAEYTDDTYVTVDRIIAYDEMTDIDKWQTGTFYINDHVLEYPAIISDETTRYYGAFILNSSTVFSTVLFNITASSTSPYWDTSAGFGTWCDEEFDDDIFTEALKKSFCWLIVGDVQNKTLQLKNQVTELMSNKVPFVYFTKIRDEWADTTLKADRTITINFDAFGAFTNTPLEDFEWELMDLDNPGWSEAHWTAFNFIENVILPAFGSVVILLWGIHFFKKLG